MKIPNFAHSFLTFRIDWEKQPRTTLSHKPPFTLNNARIQLESRCQIHDRSSGRKTDYVLGASCKTEQVGSPKNIWTEPNADFCLILSQEEFLIIKSWDRHEKGVMHYPSSLGFQPERQVGEVVDSFDRIKIHLNLVDGEPLENNGDVVKATLSDDLLNGQIEFTEQDRFDIQLDFPIKTMNANERKIFFQSDTGPILFPDFSVDYDNPIETFHLAFVAFSAPDWAEFILQVPTSLTDNIAVNHYSKPVHLNTKNNICRLPT